MTVEEVLGRMREMGCKLTPQRRLLIEVMLRDEEQAKSADEIYQQVRETYPDVGLDTVYRNLRLLARLNLVCEVKLPGQVAEYSLNRQFHQHGLVCLECGREFPLTHCPIKELEAVARQQYNFSIASHRIELFGYCDQCASERGGGS